MTERDLWWFLGGFYAALSLVAWRKRVWARRVKAAETQAVAGQFPGG